MEDREQLFSELFILVQLLHRGQKLLASQAISAIHFSAAGQLIAENSIDIISGYFTIHICQIQSTGSISLLQIPHAGPRQTIQSRCPLIGGARVHKVLRDIP